MPKKYKLFLFVVVISIAFAAGVFLSYQFQLLMRTEEVEPEPQIEREMEPGRITTEKIEYDSENGMEFLKIDTDDRQRTLSEDQPSEPLISPQEDKLAYIAPAEWERIGSIYLYDYENDEIKELVRGEDLPEQYTPKKIWWLDEKHLLFIGGFGYGTVSVGGTLYALNIETGDITEVYSEGERSEVKEISVGDREVEIKLAVFDEDFVDYEVETDQISLENIYERLD